MADRAIPVASPDVSARPDHRWEDSQRSGYCDGVLFAAFPMCVWLGIALDRRQLWLVILVCAAIVPVFLALARIASSRSRAQIGGMDRETWLVTIFVGGLLLMPAAAAAVAYLVLVRRGRRAIADAAAVHPYGDPPRHHWVQRRIEAAYRRWWQYAFVVAPLFLAAGVAALLSADVGLGVFALISAGITEWWAWASLRPHAERR